MQDGNLENSAWTWIATEFIKMAATFTLQVLILIVEKKKSRAQNLTSFLIYLYTHYVADLSSLYWHAYDLSLYRISSPMRSQ